MSGADEEAHSGAGPESDSDLLRNRRENLRRVEEMGIPVEPVRFPVTATVSEIVASHGGKTAEQLEQGRPEVATAGRVLALRTAGKAGFLDLSDGRGRVQVYARKDAVGDRDFALYGALDLGDWVGVAGDVFRTRTGELSVRA